MYSIDKNVKIMFVQSKCYVFIKSHTHLSFIARAKHMTKKRSRKFNIVLPKTSSGKSAITSWKVENNTKKPISIIQLATKFFNIGNSIYIVCN